MKSWIREKITSILEFQDDIVIDYLISQIEEPVGEELNPKQIQLNLTGFLEEKAKPLMEDLWHILLDLTKNPNQIVC